MSARSVGRRPRPGGDRPAHRWLRLLLWVTVLGILVQAGLAGPAWFQAPDLFEVHGWVGNGLLVVAAVAAVLSFAARQTVAVRFATVLLVAGLFAQIGLGYAGRRGELAVASSVHVPLGVALLGLAVAVLVAVRLGPPSGTGGSGGR